MRIFISIVINIIFISSLYAQENSGDIIFSSTPFTTLGSVNNLSTFKSSQNIYGQLQKNILKSFFKVLDKDVANKRPYYFLYYITELWKEDNKIKDNNNIWSTCFVADDLIDDIYFNFDVLTAADKVQTVLKPLDDYTRGSSGVPLINWVDKYTFSKEGTYKIKCYYKWL